MFKLGTAPTPSDELVCLSSVGSQKFRTPEAPTVTTLLAPNAHAVMLLGGEMVAISLTSGVLRAATASVRSSKRLRLAAGEVARCAKSASA